MPILAYPMLTQLCPTEMPYWVKIYVTILNRIASWITYFVEAIGKFFKIGNRFHVTLRIVTPDILNKITSPLWSLVTWIQISASMNHRKWRKQSPVARFLESLQQTEGFLLTYFVINVSVRIQTTMITNDSQLLSHRNCDVISQEQETV